MKKILTDKKAIQILSKTFWSSNGWKSKYETPPDDFSYAKMAGYMFDPVKLSHDEIVGWLFQEFEQVQPDKIADAFLASLTTRRLELRSALGSYAVARNFPDHTFTGNYFSCSICGIYGPERSEQDVSVLNFERYKWGGVRHLDPIYIALDLKLFTATEKIISTEEDLAILTRIIKIVRELPAEARVRDLEKALAKVIKSNKEEREILIQILAYCGILQPKDQIGFFDSFVNADERVLPPVSKIDWTYPACWWRGKDGVNGNSMKHYFPLLTY